MQLPKPDFFVEYFDWDKPKQIVREEFSGREEVFTRLTQLKGTYDPNRDIYIKNWQAGLPMTDYEHFYEV